jgi:hypothetical protein
MKKKWVVTQKLKTKSAIELKEYSSQVLGMLASSIYFNPPNPVPFAPSLATALSNNDALHDVLSSVNGGILKTSIIRHAKETVENDLDLLGMYVQIIANQPANKTIGDVIIHDAGMEFKKTVQTKPRVFAVINNPVQQNSVIARTVNAGKRSAYEWQYKKANESAYTIAQITIQASFTFSKLVSGTRYHFRVKTITSKGTVNLSNELELVVL